MAKTLWIVKINGAQRLRTTSMAQALRSAYDLMEPLVLGGTLQIWRRIKDCPDVLVGAIDLDVGVSTKRFGL